MIGATGKVETIQLVQPKLFKSNYVFKEAERTVGEIRYQGFSARKAEAKLFGEEWKLQQTGFWKTFIEYKAGQSPYQKGKLHAKRNCVLEFTGRNDKKYTFKKTARWKSCWGWYDEAGNELIKFSQPFAFRKQAEITIHDSQLPDKALLLLLGTVVVMINKRAAALAAAG